MWEVGFGFARKWCDLIWFLGQVVDWPGQIWQRAVVFLFLSTRTVITACNWLSGRLGTLGGGTRREKRKTNRYQQIFVACVLPSPTPSYCTTTASFTSNDKRALNFISEVCFWHSRMTLHRNNGFWCTKFVSSYVLTLPTSELFVLSPSWFFYLLTWQFSMNFCILGAGVNIRGAVPCPYIIPHLLRELSNIIDWRSVVT